MGVPSHGTFFVAPKREIIKKPLSVPVTRQETLFTISKESPHAKHRGCPTWGQVERGLGVRSLHLVQHDHVVGTSVGCGDVDDIATVRLVRPRNDIATTHLVVECTEKRLEKALWFSEVVYERHDFVVLRLESVRTLLHCEVEVECVLRLVADDTHASDTCWPLLADCGRGESENECESNEDLTHG